MSSIQENYAALLDLPIVRQLIKKNARIRKENKALKSLIYSLPEFRCDCRGYGPSTKVEIKKEKEDNIPVQCETLEEDDEVVFVAPDNETKKINIVDELDEDEQVEESIEDDKEAEEEEEAEAEEEAEEEAEAEAEEVELNLEPVRIKKVIYWKDTDSGDLYAYLPDDEVGDKVGSYVDGKPVFD